MDATLVLVLYLDLELLCLCDKLMKSKFHTNDTAIHRDHTDDANLQQVLYKLISSYYEDDCADELTKEPIMNAILGKDRLASQPTLSRFYL